MNTAHIYNQIQSVLEQISNAALAAGRRPEDVDLELAIKTRTTEECEAAARALLDLGRPVLMGQNRVQEAEVTTPFLRGLDLANLTTTMIGPLQTNKINKALRVVDQIETIDSVKLAEAINKRVKDRRLDVMIQVNTSGEASKSGADPREAIEVAKGVAGLDNLHVIGFMTIGAHTPDEVAIRKSFSDLREIRDQALTLPGLEDARELSMGMTSDFALAIAEGATRVRMGSAIFGARK
ncbi:YggS family pyridoxal phosphate-dependent enzyme [Gleimia europaea]|uniref:Pyridoxal phosphate homeostasis protein n=1 Tax=Gleimia europaea ACS-120-V-Col10b TaxID=883069 RepID=A0A9W5VVL8_9ACTO|nr:YggS family pyridoxal phosphate-dependent enzyme [Gleimia europaea]EPD29327.1 YggS family pyridoxal phosphate enzyme [Gleimia europaea ACS-120-V-Col10b]